MSRVRALVWIAEETWEGVIDGALPPLPREADVTLLYVAPEDVLAAPDLALEGLLGRARPPVDPSMRMAEVAEHAGADLLDAAAARLGRPARREVRVGRVEREVVQAAAGADLLVVARDGERARAGPRSLGPDTRFVVDHAPCPVLVVWPAGPPSLELPPPAGPAGARAAMSVPAYIRSTRSARQAGASKGCDQ